MTAAAPQQDAKPNRRERLLPVRSPRRVRRQVSVGKNDSFGAVLKNRPFLRLWLAQAISQTAQNVINFALLLRVRSIIEYHELPGANTAISLVILAFSLPAVLFGPLAGVMADRVNRRTLMAVINVLRAVCVLGFLFIRPSWEPQTALLAIYVGTFFFGIAGQFFAPAQGATIPSLVPRHQLMSANALFNLTSTGAQLVGFATAGPLIVKALQIDGTFGVTIVLFLVCAGLVITIPRTATVPRKITAGAAHPVRSIWNDIREGVIFIWQDRELIKAIGYLTLASVTFLLVATMGPEFITNVIGLPKEDIGFVVGPAGAGVLAGVLLVGRVTRRIEGPVLIDRAMAMAGVFLFLLAVSKDGLDLVWPGGEAPINARAAAAGTFAAILGICNAFILVPAQTMLQERSPEHIRARIYATFFTVSNTACFVPILFAAALADVIGVVKVLIGVAVVLSTIGVVNMVIHGDPPVRRAGRVARSTRARV
ncbi:MAG: MFS transporter, partial [Chloroflexota bacterium]|nr:MFS transporter [Chloroflexota bacterium]